MRTSAVRPSSPVPRMQCRDVPLAGERASSPYGLAVTRPTPRSPPIHLLPARRCRDVSPSGERHRTIPLVLPHPLPSSLSSLSLDDVGTYRRRACSVDDLAPCASPLRLVLDPRRAREWDFSRVPFAVVDRNVGTYGGGESVTVRVFAARRVMLAGECCCWPGMS